MDEHNTRRVNWTVRRLERLGDPQQPLALRTYAVVERDDAAGGKSLLGFGEADDPAEPAAEAPAPVDAREARALAADDLDAVRVALAKERGEQGPPAIPGPEG